MPRVLGISTRAGESALLVRFHLFHRPKNLIGARTACKDLNSNVVPETLPGVLRGLVGAFIEEYGRQNRPDLRPLALRFTGADADTTTTTLWYEQLKYSPRPTLHH